MVSRRECLAGLAAVLAVAPAAALAQAKSIEMPLKKLFPYLEPYLSLPAQARSRFVMVYRLQLQGAPQSALTLAYPAGGAVPLGPDGRVRRLPTLAMLQANGKAVVSAPKGAKLKLDLEVEPAMAPAGELDARKLAQSIAQAAAGAKKAAGVFGFAGPKFERVVFKGAAGGQAVRADGSSAPLPVIKGEPVFEPAKQPGAVRVRFTRAPSRMVLDG